MFQLVFVSDSGYKGEDKVVKAAFKSLAIKLPPSPPPKNFGTATKELSFTPPAEFTFHEVKLSDSVYDNAGTESSIYYDKQGQFIDFCSSHFQKDITDAHSKLSEIKDATLKLVNADQIKAEFLTYEGLPALSIYFKPNGLRGACGRALFIQGSPHNVTYLMVFGFDEQFVDSPGMVKCFNSLKRI